jgi:glycosyltransferase involved in cell wall biosynthesis
VTPGERPVVAHVLNAMGLGGVPQVAWQLMRRLPPDRFDLRVYSMRRARGEEDARDALQTSLEDAGVPVAFPRVKGSMLVVADLCDWLVAEGVDLVHTHSYRPNLQGRLAALPLREDGLRIVAHYHSANDDKRNEEGTLTLERALTPVTDRVIACSRAAGDHVAELLGVPPERLTVVPNAVDVERFARGGDRAAARAALGIEDDRPVVALVGRIDPLKGQDDYVRAAPLVRAVHPNALLLLVGSTAKDDVAAPIRDLIAAEGIADAVRFTGYLDDMPGLYAAIDVLAAPSRSEGFGLMLVEAMAAGVPIVASTVDAIPEVVGDGPALLVPPYDPGAVAAAINRVLDDRDAAAAMGAAGRERARAFSWERSAATLAAVYDEVLAGR